MKRKTLDECSEESEEFECRFDRLLLGEHDESERVRLVAEITAWMNECGEQGRYIASASAERRALRSLLERWNLRLRDLGYYVEEMDTLAEFDPRAGIILTGDSPYPGLEPYTQSRRGSFFGREALVSSCIDHLEQPGNRIILIVGASGSGKSSLALAGVLPRLVEMSDRACLFGPRMTPGAHPLVGLAAGVAQAIGRPDHAREIESALAAKPDEALGQLAALCQDKPLTLFIDQFEELVTLCRDSAGQDGYARVLYALSGPTVPPREFCCRILLTLRTDHLARFESSEVLKHLYGRLLGEDNQRYLSAIGFEDIKRAIKGPADEIGLRFIPASLIDQLASQTAGLSSGLPLLQFALRRLWDTRPKNESGEPLDLITAEMVNGLPDVERALGTVADGIFRTFSASQQWVCERLLLELLVLDESFEEPLRRRRNAAELRKVLEAQFATPGDVAKVIDEFVTAGLLRRFGEGPNSQVEVAHEALLRHWDHIYRLLTGAEVKERLHLVKQIGREAGDWMGHGKSDDYLSLRGERLARAVAYGADGWLAEAEAAAYVDACQAQEDAERLKDQLAKKDKERADLAERARETQFAANERLVALSSVLGAALLVVVVAAGLAVYARDAAERALDQALSMTDAMVKLFYDPMDNLIAISTLEIKDQLRRVETATEKMAAFSGDIATQPELLNTRASLHNLFGDLYARQGNFDEALTEVEKAVKILQEIELVTQQLNNQQKEDLFDNLAESYNRLAAFGGFHREPADRLISVERAIEYDVRLTQLSGNPEWRRELMLNYSIAAQGHFEQGNTDQVRQYIGKALEIGNDLKDSEILEDRHMVVGTYATLAEIHDSLGDDPSSARELYGTATDIMEGFGEMDTHRTEISYRMATVHSGLGNHLARQNELELALEEHAEAIDSLEKLVQRDPFNALWQAALANAYGSRGYALMESGETEEALKAHRQGREIWDRLIEQNDENVQALFGLLSYRNELVSIWQRQSQHQAALREAEQGKALLKRILARLASGNYVVLRKPDPGGGGVEESYHSGNGELFAPPALGYAVVRTWYDGDGNVNHWEIYGPDGKLLQQGPPHNAGRRRRRPRPHRRSAAGRRSVRWPRGTPPSCHSASCRPSVSAVKRFPRPGSP